MILISHILNCNTKFWHIMQKVFNTSLIRQSIYNENINSLSRNFYDKNLLAKTNIVQ